MNITVLAPVRIDLAAGELAWRAARLPRLEQLLARARIAHRAVPADAWLAAQLGLETDAGNPPLAALRLATEAQSGLDPRTGYWLCADPVLTTLGTNAVRVEGPVSGLVPAAAAVLITAFNAHFSADGLTLHAPHPERWYLRADEDAAVSTTPLWRARGAAMLAALPAGADGAAWRMRLNETQMLLHGHAANQLETPQGGAAIGSLWWWGGGRWPRFGPAAFAAVHGGPRWVAAACAAAGIASAPADSSVLSGPGRDRRLIVLGEEWERLDEDAAALARWDAEWFGPLADALERAPRDTETTLVLPLSDGTLVATLGAHRPAGWRRLLGRQSTEAPPLADTLRAWLP